MALWWWLFYEQTIQFFSILFKYKKIYAVKIIGFESELLPDCWFLSHDKLNARYYDIVHPRYFVFFAEELSTNQDKFYPTITFKPLNYDMTLDELFLKRFCNNRKSITVSLENLLIKKSVSYNLFEIKDLNLSAL